MEKDDFAEHYQNISFHEVYVEWVAQCSASKRFFVSSSETGHELGVQYDAFIDCSSSLKELIQGIDEFNDGLRVVTGRFEVIEEELAQDLEYEEAEQSRMKDELELLEGDEQDKGLTEESGTVERLIVSHDGDTDTAEFDHSFRNVDGEGNGQIEEGVTVKRVVCRDNDEDLIEHSTPAKSPYAVSAADVACSNGHKLRPYTSPVMLNTTIYFPNSGCCLLL